MLRISTIDSRSERRLVVEGELVQPWIEELRSAWIDAAVGLDGRKLIIDLSSATVISADGKQALLEMMREGAKFSCTGVLTKYVLRQLSHICRGRLQNSNRQVQG